MLKALRSILKWTGISLMAVLALYAVLVAIGSIAVWREKAALKADGRPMQTEDIIPPEIPDQDNAALVYNAAFKAIQDQPPLKLEGDNASPAAPTPEVAVPKKETGMILPSIEVVAQPPDNLFSQLGGVAREFNKRPDDPQAARNFETLLRDPAVSEFFSSIQRASGMPGYRQNIDYSAGPFAKTPYIADNLALSQILRAQAVYLAQTGNFAAAWQTIERSLKFAETLRVEPFLVSHLVRISQTMLVVDAIKRVAAISPPDRTTSENLSKQLGALDLQSSLETAYDGERVFGADWIFRRLYLGFVVPWDYAASLRASREIGQDVRNQTYGTSVVDIPDYAKKVPAYCFLTRLMARAVQGARQSSAQAFCEAEIARLGLAALRYKQEWGSFPPDLQALGAQALVDPFTGKPLVYRPEPDGFLLYSLGPDLTDDGGRKYDNKEKKGDIVWRYQEGSADSDAASG